MRLVISSVSLDTVSWRSKASSSKATCGSLLSGMSANKGFCRSLATRVLLGTSTIRCVSTGARGSANTVGAIRGAMSGAASMGGPSGCKDTSRSRKACWPISRSCAKARRSWKDSQRASSQLPIASALCNQEKRKAQEQPSRPAPMASRPEPTKPSAPTAWVPKIKPKTPPL